MPIEGRGDSKKLQQSGAIWKLPGELCPSYCKLWKWKSFGQSGFFISSNTYRKETLSFQKASAKEVSLTWAERISLLPLPWRFLPICGLVVGFCLYALVLSQHSWLLLCSHPGIYCVHNLQGNGNIVWGWSAFLFFLKLYLPECSQPDTEILVWKIQRQLGHMKLTLVPWSHLHLEFQIKINSQLDIYSPDVVCYMICQ